MLKKGTSTITSLGLRILVGGYLVYLAFTLIPSIQEAAGTSEMYFWIAVVAVFGLIGAVVVIFSAKSLIKGEYDKGPQEEEKDSEAEGEDSQDKGDETD
ncbi:hypothetical protein [Konateibacter massiliensis]|uniref:hypothetical protein n=1 Tax=Konateibacter massiliensis TaxID=2002841 RepID=UPI000C1496DE|nr:hypothetical protein [Konateibacter massiliensis]